MRVAVGRGAVTPVVADAILGVCVAVGLLAAAVAEVGPGAMVSARPVDAGAVALAATIAAASQASPHPWLRWSCSTRSA